MIIVLASGSGSNFEAIVKNFPNKVDALICNVDGAYVFQRAKNLGIPSFLIPHKNFSSREAHEREIINSILAIPKVKLIVLAGYMRVFTSSFFSQIHLPIINLHPAHLDDYKGAHAYEYAFEKKFPRWGISVHKVTEVLDSGELIESGEIPLYPYESITQLKKRVQNFEHKLLVTAIRKIIE